MTIFYKKHVFERHDRSKGEWICTNCRLVAVLRAPMEYHIDYCAPLTLLEARLCPTANGGRVA